MRLPREDAGHQLEQSKICCARPSSKYDFVQTRGQGYQDNTIARYL